MQLQKNNYRMPFRLHIDLVSTKSVLIGNHILNAVYNRISFPTVHFSAINLLKSDNVTKYSLREITDFFSFVELNSISGHCRTILCVSTFNPWNYSNFYATFLSKLNLEKYLLYFQVNIEHYFTGQVKPEDMMAKSVLF